MSSAISEIDVPQSLPAISAPPVIERYYWLDVLRGLAALIVLVSHVSIFGLYGHEHALATFPPTRLLWAGHQSVILFFVISGFALFMLFQSMAAGDRGWLRFIWIRVVRLYPPYAASLVLALVVLYAPHLLHMTPPAGAPTIAQGLSSARELLYHFLMIGRFDVMQLNPPIWSLVQEMRLSLLFPLLYFVVIKGGWKAAATAMAIWIGAVVLSAAFEYRYLPRSPNAQSMFATVRYGMMFLLGAWIARYRSYVIQRISGASVPAKVVVLLMALLAFMYSHGYNWEGWAPWWAISITEMVTAFASACFVALAISVKTPVRSAIVRFLGMVCYSLYLTHQIVIMSVIFLFYGKYSALVLWMISIGASLMVAQIFYVIIEAPSISASRRGRVSRAVSSE